MQVLKIRNSIKISILVLLFFVISQFMNMQVYWSLLMLLIVGIAPFLMGKKMYRLPVGQLILLLLTMSTYFYIFKKNNSVTMYHYVVYFLGPVLFYYAGMYLMMLDKKKYRECFLNMLLIASLGGTVYALLCILNKQLHMGLYDQLFSESGIISMMYARYTLDCWSNALVHPTNLNSYCVLAIINLYPAYRFEKRKVPRILFFIAGIIAVFVCIKTATRSNLVFLVLAVLLTLFFGLKRLDMSALKVNKNKIILAAMIMLAVVVFSGYLLEILQNSALGQRMEIENASLENGRFERMYVVFEQLLNYPYGNMPHGHAHNIILDVARVSGLIPMVFMILYLFSTAISCLRVKNINVSRDIKIWAQTVVFGMLIAFQSEPVLEGRPYIFMTFCFLTGMVKIMEKEKMKS